MIYVCARQIVSPGGRSFSKGAPGPSRMGWGSRCILHPLADGDAQQMAAVAVCRLQIGMWDCGLPRQSPASPT
jgi:hypothetical protein